MVIKQTSYHKGVAAEHIISDHYLKAGYLQKEMRMKTAYGEVDLIVEKQNQWVFVEVKCSKTFAKAAARISAQQIERIQAAAEDYLSKQGLWEQVDCRFDAALVDASGNVEILENAFI